jgi:hypothetical protein
MSLYQFIGLGTNQQAEFILRGTYLATRFEENYCVLLYQLNDFFAEVFYNIVKWEISHINGFRSRSHLIPYGLTLINGSLCYERK